MKTFIASLVLVFSTSGFAQDCRRIELHIEKLQEQLYQCQNGDGPGRPDSSNSSCSIQKNNAWEVKVAGSTVTSAWDFATAASAAKDKERQGLCRFEKPSCAVTKNNAWEVTAAGGVVTSAWDFETAARAAQDLEQRDLCHLQVPTCSVVKSNAWEVRVGNGVVTSAWDFDTAARAKNDLVSRGLCR